MFNPMLNDKNNKIKNNESKICKLCKGKCCKKIGCEISPKDLKDYPNITKESIIQLLETGYVSIDCYEDDYPKYFLRMRNKNSKIIDISLAEKWIKFTGKNDFEFKLEDMPWFKECIALTENGCRFKFENRPLAGRSLKPNYNERRCSSNYTKKDCTTEWGKYQDILDDIVDSIEYGNLKINYDSKYDEIKSCMSDEEKNIHKSLMFESMINSINRGNIK